MATVSSEPQPSLSERELILLCNIHYIEYKKFKPFNVHYDLLLKELQNKSHVIKNRINIKPLYDNNTINDTMAYHVVFLNHIPSLECLDKTLFEWINIKNDRLCTFMWAYIICSKEKKYPVNDFEFEPSLGLGFGLNQPAIRKTFTIPAEVIIEDHPSTMLGGLLHKFKFFETSPHNNNLIKNSIISFFDAWDASLDDKKTTIQNLEKKWSNISKKDDIERWINPKDVTKSDWAWHYIHKNKSPEWFINNDHIVDKLNGVITTFDLLNEYPDKRELLKKNMKLAWSQKSYRDKNNGKKAVSIVLSEDIIKKLDFICENTDRRKNEVVTRLIRDEYETIKKSGH